ncbi:hypothetical protein BKA70DRAFT_1350101 [Coprinopsis sp. MPI-PUGE-AT-0042]|nr:hypothetical protein BKA70DRAFT_1350101 [Coprinopsis sp. MPI-PUGE-AT-0042]
MISSTTNGKGDQDTYLKVEIKTTDEMKALSAQLLELGDDNGAQTSPQITHFSIVLNHNQLPLGGDKEGRDNSHTLIHILSRVSSLSSFTTLSLSCSLDNTALRLDWRTLDSSSPGQDIASALSLQPWSQSDHHLPKLNISGVSQVPAQVMYAWLDRSSAISLECVSLDYSTFANFQVPSNEARVPPPSTKLDHCCLKLRTLELANLIHFHQHVLRDRSPLLGLKSLELWVGGPLRTVEMVVQSLDQGSLNPPSLEYLAIYRWFDRAICGDDPSTSKVTAMALRPDRTPNIHTFVVGVKVNDLTDIPFQRKAIRSVLKFTSTTLHSTRSPVPNLEELDYIFLDGYNIGSESLKYHATQFIEMFRDAFQRPGHRTEWFKRHYPSLKRVRIVIRREKMDEIVEDEMMAFRDVADEVAGLGEGAPSISIGLEDLGSGH